MGQNIHTSPLAGIYTRGFIRGYRGTFVPAPDGNGKIYTMYIAWDDEFNEFGGRFKLYFGYTFTMDTTDADIITQCRVVRTLLHKYFLGR